MIEETLQGKGVKLHARSWKAQGAARGVVVLVHGFKSHSGLYEWVAEQLTARGLAVYAVDLRGHGKSEGERYYVEKFADYVSDVDTLFAVVKEREPNLPKFILGHSAGGVVSCLYTLEHQGDLAGFICESFAFEVPAPDVALAILKGISHVAPHAHVLDLKAEDFSRDPKFVEKMKSDPLVPDLKYASLTVAEMVRADERLKKEFPLFTLPLLILHGSADKAAKPHGSHVFNDAASSKDKTLKIYEGHFHDLLNDVDKERVMSDVTEWITTHIKGV